MKVIFSLPKSINADEKFQNLVVLVGCAARTEVAQTLEDLTLRLGRPKPDLAFAFLIIGNQEELASLIYLGSLLQDIRIIIILPDRDKDTIGMGYKLSLVY